MTGLDGVFQILRKLLLSIRPELATWNFPVDRKVHTVWIWVLSPAFAITLARVNCLNKARFR